MKQTSGALACLLLGLVGLGVCAYLTFVHLAMLRGDLVGGFGCGTSSHAFFSCHAVTGSAFGSFLGVPLSLWGMIGYFAVLALALIAWQLPEASTNALTCLAALGVVFVVMDLGLLAVMLTTLQHVCPL